MKKALIFFLLLTSLIYSDVTIKDRLIKATPGDYIVTAQGSNYSVLLLRSKEGSRVVLEEITVEQSKIDTKKTTWKKWIESKGPNAISWTAVALDLEKQLLTQCYSYTDKQWLIIEEADYLFKNLLSLPFRPTRDNERKRVGPAPMPGEIDRRKLWKPQLTREGKKSKGAEYEVLRSKWPADKTQLAGCIIEFYLDAANPTFAFPHWIEVQHPHFTFKIRAIDSGSSVSSPMPLLKG